MSLNEGDVLAVGSGGSAVLQFANGTSEDDKMTVASNAKLTFSKLSNKKGTTTKVSMWSGSAWVDVKSITNKEDQFTLETPTAVMGVRGTHLLVTVNPNTGATNLMVAAGVVQTTSTGGGGQSQNVYPTQNALITKDGADGSDVTIAPADLEALMQQGDAEIVKAIIQGAKDITEENEQYVQRYENGEVPTEIGGTNADLERFKNNTQNLLGALVTKAVETGLISQDRMNQLIDEASNQTGFKVDVTKSSLQLTEAEKAKQEAQRKKEEAVAKLEAERKAKEEAERKKLEDMIRKLEEERKAKEKAAQEAAEAKKKEAQEKYESQLSEAEKNRLRAEANKRQEEIKAAQSSASPSSTPTPSPSSGSSSGSGPVLSNNANLSGLTVSLPYFSENLIAFNGSETTYTINVSNTTGTLVVKPTLEQSNASVEVKGQPLIGGEASVALLSSGTSAGTTTTIPVVVTAQNGTTKKTYTLIVNREASLLTDPITIQGVDGFVFKPDQGTYTLNPVAETTSSLQLSFGTLPSGVSVSVTNNGMSVSPQNGAYIVPLSPGNNRIVITVFSGGLSYIASLSGFEQLGALSASAMTIQNYTINVTRAASNDASISAAFINFAERGDISLNPNESGNYEEMTTGDWANVHFIPTQADGATLIVKKGNEIVSPDYLSLDMGINVFSVIVTAPDGVTTRTYALTITRIEAIPLYLTSWSVAESLNGAPLKRIHEGYGEGGYEFTASVAVAEDEDTIQFNMLWDGDVIPESIHIYDLYANEIGEGYTNEGTGINISEDLPLESEGTYTTYRLEYYVQQQRYNIELVVLRGAPNDEDYTDVYGVSILTGGDSLFSVFAYDEQSFTGMVGAEGIDSSFSILPDIDYNGFVSVFQIIDGARVELDEDFMGFMTKSILAGWNDFEIDVWDRSVQKSKKMYELHLYVGMDVPEAFAGIGFEADEGITIGASSVNPSMWYVDRLEQSEEVLIKPTGIPGGVVLNDVSLSTGYEMNTITFDVDGYYHLPLNGESSLVFSFESGGRQFVYTVHAVPYAAGELNSLNLMPIDESNYSLLDFNIPVSLGDNQYFSSYRGGEANLMLYVEKADWSGNVKVFLGENTEPVPQDGYSFNLSSLSEGWNIAKIKVDDSFNSGNPTVYKLWIWIGDQPPSGFAFDSIYAEDVAEHIVEFQQDATNPFIWTTEVVPEVLFIGKDLTEDELGPKVTKVLYSYDVIADDSDGSYEINLEGGTTDAQMWVTYNGVTFVYRLQIKTVVDKPPYVTALSSAVITLGTPVVWEYDNEGVKRFIASVDLMSEEGITVNMVPANGYQITYSTNNGQFDSETGRWTGLSLGLNTLSVTITHGSWSDTYTFQLYVSDSTTS